MQSWCARAASVVIILLGFALFMQDADARRLGGGKSFGRQSQGVTRQQAAPQQPSQGTAANPQPQSPAPAGGNRWLGALGGLAAGLGISALLSHFGLMGPFASAMGSVLMVGLLVLGGFLLWRMFAQRAGSANRNVVLNERAPALQTQPVGSGAPMGSSAMGSSASTNVYGSPLRPTTEAAPAASPWNVPADFDTAGFLRSAKVYFTRLQAAWDAKDFDDIRKFTTPEAFAEIKMQSDEAPGKTDRTEIGELEATLLGIETTPAEYFASVRFTGTLREDGGNPEAFVEVWNLAKPIDGRSGWLLAGIQQVH
jgi:predicted lipid-binding transport protein (Tim44 family)